MAKRSSRPTRRKARSRALSERDLDQVSAGTAASGLGELDGDGMLSAFMKLNMNDPNLNPDTHEALHNAAKNTRKQRP